MRVCVICDVYGGKVKITYVQQMSVIMCTTMSSVATLLCEVKIQKLLAVQVRYHKDIKQRYHKCITHICICNSLLRVGIDLPSNLIV